VPDTNAREFVVVLPDWHTLTIAPRKDPPVKVAPPDLPEFEACVTALTASDEGLILDRVRLELDLADKVAAAPMQISEAEIRGLAVQAGLSPGMRLTDVVFRRCDLSNVDGREGSLNRVEFTGSKLIGFSVASGRAWDLRVTDCTMSLASFAFTGLRDVVFERVNLREASFVEARLEGVEFIDCQLEGTDFRRAKLKNCAIRGSALDAVVGIESLKGVTMPWSDVVASAAALAHAVGIRVE
jgi:uncharacterized protein YjbI with pentapeptide repeats